jgi:hypothetical protein
VALKHLKRNTHRRIAGLAATFALCAGWSASALSATTTSIECDDLIRDLRSLEIPTETLSVTTVDHVSIEPISSDIELLDAQSASSETAAPFLFLTPRVASVLRDIFEVPREQLPDQDEASETTSSPFVNTLETAESNHIPDISELLDQSDPAGTTDNEINLPLFQQRMFRTDI